MTTKIPSAQTIGERLRVIRRVQGLTAKELGRLAAKHLGRRRPISESAVRNQENGTNGVPLDVLTAYCAVMNIPLAYFIGNVAPPGMEIEKPPATDEDEEDVSFGDIAAMQDYAISGIWRSPEVKTPEALDGNVLYVWIPGFEGAELSYHEVIDDTMWPIYPKGTLLIVCDAKKMPPAAGDHVIAWYERGHNYPRFISVREVRLSRGDVELRAIGDRNPGSDEALVLLTREREQLLPLWIASVVVGTFRLVNTNRRPPLFLPDEVFLDLDDEPDGALTNTDRNSVDPDQQKS